VVYFRLAAWFLVDPGEGRRCRGSFAQDVGPLEISSMEDQEIMEDISDPQLAN